jgi:hypothetical protein
MVVSAIDDFEVLATAANAAHPTPKRPRPALRSAEIGHPASATTTAWPGSPRWRAGSRSSGSPPRPEKEPGIKFGWPKPGQLGSGVRAS